MKQHPNTSNRDIMRYGTIVKANSFETNKGIYSVFIIKYENDIYFYKMKNGEVVEVVNLTNNPAP